jgi:thioesterase domain-containing protein
MKMAAQVSSRFGIELPLRTFLLDPTIESLAAAIDGHGRDGNAGPLLVLREGGDRPPLVCVHPAAGTSLCYRKLARHLPPDLPVLGLEAPGLADPALALTIPEMARLYVRSVEERQPRGPYHLFGWSFGGLVAWEMARQWQDAGADVALLALVDAWPRATAPESTGNADEDAFFALLAELAAGADIVLPTEVRAPEHTSPEAQLDRLIRQVEPGDAQAAQFLRALGLRLLNEGRRSVVAAQAYVPPRLAGHVDLFVATGEDGTRLDRLHAARRAWGDASIGALRLHPVAGSHSSLVLAEGNVARLAMQIANRMRITEPTMAG